MLDHLKTAENVALGVDKGLALLGDDVLGQVVLNTTLSVNDPHSAVNKLMLKAHHALNNVVPQVKEVLLTREDGGLLPTVEGILGGPDGLDEFILGSLRHLGHQLLRRGVPDLAMREISKPATRMERIVFVPTSKNWLPFDSRNSPLMNSLYAIEGSDGAFAGQCGATGVSEDPAGSETSRFPLGHRVAHGGVFSLCGGCGGCCQPAAGEEDTAGGEHGARWGETEVQLGMTPRSPLDLATVPQDRDM